MRTTDYQSASDLGQSVPGPKMDGPVDPRDQELLLESFQKHVAEKFNELSSSGSSEILSLSWLSNLLDLFISCQEEFRVLLISNNCCLNKPPMDRLIAEFDERNVKALDVCNAIRDGIEQVRQWEKLLEIVMCSVGNGDNRNPVGDGQIRRAKKALVELLIGMLDEKESNVALSTHRNRSFGSRNKDQKNNLGHFRSLSWSVSRSWSASKQLQAMGGSLNPPKGNDIMATNGLALAFYTMSCVVMFVMWVLVAAIPCQDRGLQTHFSIPKQFVWASSVLSLHDRIVEESKKRERKNACGLLKEIYQTEKWTRQMNELLDSLQLPLALDKEAEVREKVEELRVVFESLKHGLHPLERQVREVFHRIVRSRSNV